MLHKLTTVFRAFALVMVMNLAFPPALHSAAMAQATMPVNEVTVYKSPYCGCCGKWVQYMRGHGFDVTVHDMDDLSTIKTMAGVPAKLQSCHTAMIGGYVLEGHVPVDAVRRLLDSGAKVQGLAVPGMPVGSPGMEGGSPEAYTVYSFADDDNAEPFMTFPAR
jgi:hypothetical protein